MNWSFANPLSASFPSVLKIDAAFAFFRSQRHIDDGAGYANLTLRGGIDCGQVITQMEPWVFERRQGEYLRTSIPLTDLAPGDYCLDFRQAAGWGMYEYTLSHGGGKISQQLALATGMLAATTVVVAIGYAGLLLLRLGIITPTPNGS